MPRKLRLFVPGGIYHVYCRASRGEMIFTENDEAEDLISEIRHIKERDKFRVFAFCVMGNHYHVGLQTNEVPLWKSMLSIQASVARRHNRKHRVLGPLWQSRYKARIVEEQKYFDQLLAYIHLNPVAAGLVDDPAQYRWSGHCELLGTKKPDLVDVEQALRSFGSTFREARSRYLEFVRIYAETRSARKGIRCLPWWSTVLNDDETVAPEFEKEYQDFDGKPFDIDRPNVALVSLSEYFSECLGVDFGELSCRSTTRRVANIRAMFAAIAIEYYHHPATEVASLLNKHPGSVSRYLDRGWQLRMTEEFSALLKTIDHAIRSSYNRETAISFKAIRSNDSRL